MTLRLLALDTSTEACSAALLAGGEMHERYELAPRSHGHLILAMAQALLDEAGLTAAQLDAVAFGRGPGAFTGVRIATGVVQGIAFGADLPVVPVSSLAALAQEAMDRDDAARVLAAIDARMGELYWGAYRRDAHGYARLVGVEEVQAPDAVAIPPADQWCGAGSGWATHGDKLAHRLAARLSALYPDRYPRASSIARLGELGYRTGQAVSAEQALPVYLRNKVVHGA